MSRFEKRPKTTIAVILILAFVSMAAATEWLLTPGSGKTLIRGDESLPRPQRHLVLREWLPSSVFEFGPPAERRLNSGGQVLDVYRLETDRDGFIEPSRPHDNPDLDIVFLGGSTTECLYVAPERRFPVRVGRLLEEQLGLRINAINGGKSGNNTLHSTLALIGKVLPQRPDLVVLMQNVNDLGVLGQPGGYWSDDSDFRLVRSRLRSVENVVRDLRDMAVPYTYRAVRRALRTVWISEASAAATDTPAGAAVDNRLERIGADFESALRSFVAITKAWGIRPVLMTQAKISSRASGDTAVKGNDLAEDRLRNRRFIPSEFENAHGYFNAIVRHVAIDEAVLLVDLAGRHWTQDDLYDGLHFNDDGSERAARIVAEALASEVESAVAGRR